MINREALDRLHLDEERDILVKAAGIADLGICF